MSLHRKPKLWTGREMAIAIFCGLAAAAAAYFH